MTGNNSSLITNMLSNTGLRSSPENLNDMNEHISERSENIVRESIEKSARVWIPLYERCKVNKNETVL